MENTNALVVVFAILLGQCLFLAVLALAGALIIQFGTKLIAKFKPTYRAAYFTAFLSYLPLPVGIFIYRFVAGFFRHSLFVKDMTAVYNPTEKIWAVPAAFLIPVIIYGLLIKHPEKGPIGFAKGLFLQCLNCAFFFAVLIFLFMAISRR
jgi:hypothetical protein